MNWLSTGMIEALKFFFGLSGNWGIAIILLTAAIKIVLYPLTVQSTRQMAAMQRLQPKIEKLQKDCKDKPDQLQKETIELYKKEGVNPLGGCLPMLLQIPIFIAFFYVLTGKEFAEMMVKSGIGAQFLWINNLAKPDPSLTMVLLIGFTTYWSSLTMPGGASKQNRTMLFLMPGFIAIISLSFAAGVQLYWVTQNVLTIAQQLYITRGIKK